MKYSEFDCDKIYRFIDEYDRICFFSNIEILGKKYSYGAAMGNSNTEDEIINSLNTFLNLSHFKKFKSIDEFNEAYDDIYLLKLPDKKYKVVRL